MLTSRSHVDIHFCLRMGDNGGVGGVSLLLLMKPNAEVTHGTYKRRQDPRMKTYDGTPA